MTRVSAEGAIAALGLVYRRRLAVVVLFAPARLVVAVERRGDWLPIAEGKTWGELVAHTCNALRGREASQWH